MSIKKENQKNSMLGKNTKIQRLKEKEREKEEKQMNRRSDH